MTLVWSAIFLLIAPHLVLAQSPECGSLITYRQYSDLLSQAPKCFREGCNGGNISSVATTISSPCPVQAPCNQLWDIIRTKFEQDWCASCHGDVACRIGGWPILNMTNACNVSPGEWIFAGNGGCCSSGNEPFQITDWIETLCNGSEWRAPFAFYGGMAQADWEEWIESWNWTLRPKSPVTHENLPEPDCNSSAFLRNLGYDNLIKVIGFVLNTIVVILVKTDHMPFPIPEDFRKKAFFKKFHWYGALLGGASEFLSTLMGNIGVAVILGATPNYEDTPVWDLIILMSSRPSVLGFLCGLGIFAVVIDDTTGDWANDYLLRFFADTIASLAFCEFLQQIWGSYYLGKTAHVGQKKHFFGSGHLTPYWRGKEAHWMYAGGMIWTVFSPFTILGFLLLAAFQVERLYRTRPVLEAEPSWLSVALQWTHPFVLRFLVDPYLRFMNGHYAKRWAKQDNPNGRLGEVTPGTGTTVTGATAPHRNRGDTETTEDVQATERSILLSEPDLIDHPEAAIRETTIETGTPHATYHPQPSTPPPRPGVSRRSLARVSLRFSLIVSARPFRWLVTRPYLYFYKDPGTEPEGLKAITRLVYQKYHIPALPPTPPRQQTPQPTEKTPEASGLQPQFPPGRVHAAQSLISDVMRGPRLALSVFMLALWIIVYISQWLFWVGFVRSSGLRWCPPGNELSISKIQAVLLALSFFGVTINFGFNY